MRASYCSLLLGVLAAVACDPWTLETSRIASSGDIKSLRAAMQEADRGVMVVAHRGCWRDNAENSIRSIERCIELGAHVAEIDVRRTQDGVLVALHDRKLDRTTTGSGVLAETPHSELAALRLLSGAGRGGADPTPYRVPSFQEVMRAAEGRILINVDAKQDAPEQDERGSAPAPPPGADVLEQVVAELEAMGLADHAILKKETTVEDAATWIQRPIFQDVLFMPKFTEADAPLSAFASAIAAFRPLAVEIKFRTDAFLVEGEDDLSAAGARIWVSTLDASPHKSAGRIDTGALEDPDAHWGELIEMGVDMVQTDRPGALIEYLSKPRAD